MDEGFMSAETSCKSSLNDIKSTLQKEIGAPVVIAKGMRNHFATRTS